MLDNLDDDGIRDLALRLLHSDGETEVVEILKEAHLWEDRTLWRLYGDKEGNFAQAGNQQALPEAALVEKIVNSCDARLMCECRLRGIDPEGDRAPRSVRDAVATFFEGRRSEGDEAGTLLNWASGRRLEESRQITIAATGSRPTPGKKPRPMCLTIADQGEGQSPAKLRTTILSLNEKNKQRIRFVQGKFNMGGSGALRFCGTKGLQLIISRRHPKLAELEKAEDATVGHWGITVVRREEPTDRTGEPIHSEYTYLAPVGAAQSPRKGGVLSFVAANLPLMPEQDNAYVRPVSWGTAIKLYEYETIVGRSNVLLSDGLLYAVERLLPEIALPVHMHECRGYVGKKGSFDTPIAGLVVRLEDGKGDNLETGFPLPAELQIEQMHMKARIYAFKEDKAQTYLHDEGVIFTVNGQAHGYLPKSIFTRPKAVGLPRLKDSLLVLVDCSSLNATCREDFFMSSRDRLSKKPIRYLIEDEIEALLRNHPELKRLQQERRKRDVESKLSDEKPLEQVLSRILASSPTLRALFIKGQRLARPFPEAGGEAGSKGAGVGAGADQFRGKRHPTYFRIPGLQPGGVFGRNCEYGRRCRIEFETDVENEYLERATDRGSFDVKIISDAPGEFTGLRCSLILNDGAAFLSMVLPTEASAGKSLSLRFTVQDPTLITPFVTMIRLRMVDKQAHPPGPVRPRKPRHGGAGDEPAARGIQLPRVIPVRESDEYWLKYKFDSLTACHVISDPVEVAGKEQLEHTFYVNVDNASLRTEMKYSKQDARLLEAKFRYGNALLGLAILHDAEKAGDLRTRQDNPTDDGDDETESPQECVRRVSKAVAPVLIPIIDQLSGLNEEHLQEVSEIGEDA